MASWLILSTILWTMFGTNTGSINSFFWGNFRVNFRVILLQPKVHLFSCITLIKKSIDFSDVNGIKIFHFFFFQFFFTIVASFLEIFDGGTDIKSVKIYGDSCNHCTDVAESKFRILYAGPLHLFKLWSVVWGTTWFISTWKEEEIHKMTEL